MWLHAAFGDFLFLSPAVMWMDLGVLADTFIARHSDIRVTMIYVKIIGIIKIK